MLQLVGVDHGALLPELAADAAIGPARTSAATRVEIPQSSENGQAVGRKKGAVGDDRGSRGREQ